MRKYLSCIILILIQSALGTHPVYAQKPDLQTKLFTDIQDGKLDDFSHIEAAFILSGVNSPDSLTYYLNWFNNLVAKIKGFHFDEFHRLHAAKKLFNYVRTSLYDEYKLDATTLPDIVNKRMYNCVSSTILYNTLCEALGWQTEAFETPTHVYTIFTDFGKKVIVENTHPMGFDIMKNLHVYSSYLASFYPESQRLKIGLDRLYEHENSQGRMINNTELLGLLAYNQAYFAMKRGDYKKAYDLILVAQDFNEKSPSNEFFEQSLYYKWGKQCYEEGRFYDAFEVFCDGTFRYPKNKDFAQNCRAAFFQTLQRIWQTKNVELTLQMIDEIRQLKILTEKDRQHLKFILQRWLSFYTQTGNKKATKSVRKYFNNLN